MKKFFILFFALFAIPLFAGAKEFYPLAMAGGNGAFEVYQSGSSDFIISNSKLTTHVGYREVSAPFKKNLDNGWSLYRSSKSIGGMTIVEEYVVSPNKNHIIEITSNGNAISSIVWYSSDKVERQKFYKKNKNNQRTGLDFSVSTDDSLNSSTDGSSNGSKNCSVCNGTKINPTPNTGGSRYNWVGYYNHANNKCPYCGKYSQHFHDKCSHCSVPSH